MFNIVNIDGSITKGNDVDNCYPSFIPEINVSINGKAIRNLIKVNGVSIGNLFVYRTSEYQHVEVKYTNIKYRDFIIEFDTIESCMALLIDIAIMRIEFGEYETKGIRDDSTMVVIDGMSCIFERNKAKVDKVITINGLDIRTVYEVEAPYQLPLYHNKRYVLEINTDGVKSLINITSVYMKLLEVGNEAHINMVISAIK